MGRINHVCEYGVIHETAQCRCMSSHVTKRQIKCSVPEQHRVSTDETPSTTPMLHDRLTTTLNTFLGSAVMPVVIESMADSLENDVKAWLADHIND